MQVTKKSIEETAGTDCRDWFVETFGEDAEVDAYIVVEKLREQKNTEDWMFMIFYKYKLSGLCESFYSDESIAERYMYKAGEKNGLCEWFHPNGLTKARDTYKDNKEDGLYESFYPDGSPLERGTFKNGNRVGEWERWDENGEKIN